MLAEQTPAQTSQAYLEAKMHINVSGCGYGVLQGIFIDDMSRSIKVRPLAGRHHYIMPSDAYLDGFESEPVVFLLDAHDELALR
jgi:hypothetical protein